MRRIRLKLHGGGSYITATDRVRDLLSDLEAELDGFEVGDAATFTLSIVEMSDAEYEAMPEFSGH